MDYPKSHIFLKLAILFVALATFYIYVHERDSRPCAHSMVYVACEEALHPLESHAAVHGEDANSEGCVRVAKNNRTRGARSQAIIQNISLVAKTVASAAPLHTHHTFIDTRRLTTLFCFYRI